MNLYAPGYYKKFRCIADKCRHSCCVGWEIDVDDNTYEKYCSCDSDFFRKIKDHIAEDSEGRHFALTVDERCPFLRDDNLCDIIINMGEDALCQICADHPRFRNFYSDRTEIGLGMCCEAACKLILSDDGGGDIECVSGIGSEEISGEDEYFFSLRSKYIDILQNRSIPLENRLNSILEIAGISLPEKELGEWVEIYLSLEHLEAEWIENLKRVADSGLSFLKLNSEYEIETERMAIYFIYRHLADGRFDFGYCERVAFAVLSVYIINTVFSVCCPLQSFDDFINVARMYSSEIEYSEENLRALLEIF